MIQKYFISAYASSGVLSNWNEEAETYFFQGLAEDPLVQGIEIPIVLEGTAYPTEWLCKRVPGQWQLHLTTLPAMMMMAQQDPCAGFASTHEEGRERALTFIKKTRSYAEELEQRLGRPAVSAVTLYSSPPPHLGMPCASKEALWRSLQEVRAMNWGTLALNLEHCDAFTKEHSADKGFLSLEEEIDVLREVGDIGLVLNWARSAIEKRSTTGALQHLQEALSHQLLRGMIFSGCTSSLTNPYGKWKDSHMPPSGLPSGDLVLEESLLGKKELVEVLKLLTNHSLFLGIKISNRLQPFHIKRSLTWNLETISLLEEAINENRER